MLQNIKPRPKHSKSKDGSLTAEEKVLVNGLLAQGYQAQDIAYIINQGRSTTINQARIINDHKAKIASEDEVKKFLQIQKSYDPKTLLNPHKDQRLIRAREAMMAAVQVFNNPTMIFRAELFCVLANIAWTYLFHEKLEKTKAGSSKIDNGNSITVGGTLDRQICPIKDKAVIANLKQIVKIRDEVEHTFFVGGDEYFGPLFQACCVNFERHMIEWFGEHLSLSKELSLALQFVRLQKDQIIELEKSNLPPKIKAITQEIENSEFVDNNAFQLNVFYSTEVSSKTNADIHKLVTYGADSNVIPVAVKKVDYTRLTQAQIVEKVQSAGYKKFTTYEHQKFWTQKWKNAAERHSKAKKYGELLLKSQWMWFEQTWLPEVLEYCKNAGGTFK